jgi:hypothetical protein
VNREQDETTSGLDPHLVAVIAAAASVVLGGPVAVHHVSLHGQREAERWSRAGRKAIMLSHQPRPKP